MSSKDWDRIASEYRLLSVPFVRSSAAGDIEERYDQYDGFVVLHGTDTMGYTASALSFMLRWLGKPVVITG